MPRSVLQIPRAFERQLEEGLRAFEFSKPALEHLELRVASDGSLVALLRFEAGGAAPRQRAAALAARLGGQSLPADPLPWQARKAVVRGRAPGVAEAFTQLRAAPLRLSFASQAALLEAWALQVAQGALFVPEAATAPLLSPCVTLATPQGDYPDNLFRVVSRAAPPGEAGRWLELSAGPALLTLLQRTGAQRREDQPPSPQGRAHPHFVTDLSVQIEGMAELAEQWASDLSRGGLFVCTQEAPPLGSEVRVQLTLPSLGALSFRGQVVHRVLSGPRVGVGLQLLEPDPAALASIEALLARYHARRPRVLVVDDEAIWRSTLVRVLKLLDVEVVLARDGREGLLALIDGYFELDLVILDLHMPQLDGRALIDRVRRLGRDGALKLFLFSAAPGEELAALGAPGLATAVFSKLDPIEQLAARLAQELHRPWPPASRQEGPTAGSAPPAPAPHAPTGGGPREWAREPAR